MDISIISIQKWSQYCINFNIICNNFTLRIIFPLIALHTTLLHPFADVILTATRWISLFPSHTNYLTGNRTDLAHYPLTQIVTDGKLHLIIHHPHFKHQEATLQQILIFFPFVPQVQNRSWEEPQLHNFNTFPSWRRLVFLLITWSTSYKQALKRIFWIKKNRMQLLTK